MASPTDDPYAEAEARIAEAAASSATTLSLAGAHLDRIPPEIAGLTGLTSLQLDATSVTDLRSIAGLTGLEHLSLSNNFDLIDISPIAGLSNLRGLDLHNTNVRDLRPLSGLINLERLNLAYDGVTNIAPLANLTRLRFLNMKNNSVLDFRPLRKIDLQPDETMQFSQCVSDDLPNFDPVLADLIARDGPVIPYLRALDDATYDRRLAAFRAAQAAGPDDLDTRIEGALAGPILVDAIADIVPRGPAFDLAPVDSQGAVPTDRSYRQRVDVLAYAARRLAGSEAQNRLQQSVVASAADYAAQVVVPGVNPRLLQFLVDGISGALSNPEDRAALDGMDIAHLRSFLAEHTAFIAAFFPQVAAPPSFTSGTDPAELAAVLPGLLREAGAELARMAEAGILLPPVSDMQETLIRQEDAARRGYLTASPARRDEAGRALQRIAVTVTGFFGRMVLRLKQYGAESAEWARKNPVAAARNVAFLAGLATKLWALVAPHIAHLWQTFP